MKLFFLIVCTSWIYNTRSMEWGATHKRREGASDSIEDKIEGAILGALVADALTLGLSYEFSAKKIQETISKAYSHGDKREDWHYVGLRYHKPGDLFTHNYHKGRKDGDQTDNGDGNIYLLEYFSKLGLKKTLPFNIVHYVTKYWIQLYKGHGNAYDPTSCRACGAKIDPAVKTFLENVEKGVAVEDAGGEASAHVVRFAGALAIYHGDEDMLTHIAAATTSFTHRCPDATAASVFWAHTVHRVIDGMEPEAAIRAAAALMHDNEFIVTKVNEAIEKVHEATDPDSALSKEDLCDDLAVTSFGTVWTPDFVPIKGSKSTIVSHAFPAALYFVLKYGSLSFRSAVQANVMVGGDSSTRAIPIGMILGAHYGLSEGIPSGWVATLHAEHNVKKMIKPFTASLAGTKTTPTAHSHEEEL